MRLARLAIPILILASCSDAPPAVAPAEAPPSRPAETIAYACDGGVTAQATYSADGALRLSVRGETWAMNPADAVSGSRWTGQSLEWWVTREAEGEVGTLRQLGAAGVGEAVVLRCLRGSEPRPDDRDPDEVPQPAGATACAATRLSLELVAEDAGAGQRHATLAFRNDGAEVCVLQGYPRVSLLGPDGARRTPFRMLETPLAEGAEPGAVSLAPGGRAYFDVSTTAVAGEVAGESEPCPAVTAIQAEPPDGGGDARVGVTLNPCNHRGRVSPIRANVEPSAG